MSFIASVTNVFFSNETVTGFYNCVARSGGHTIYTMFANGLSDRGNRVLRFLQILKNHVYYIANKISQLEGLKYCFEWVNITMVNDDDFCQCVQPAAFNRRKYLECYQRNNSCNPCNEVGTRAFDWSVSLDWDVLSLSDADNVTSYINELFVNVTNPFSKECVTTLSEIIQNKEDNPYPHLCGAQ